MKVLLIWLWKMWQFHLNNLIQIDEVDEIYAFDVNKESFKNDNSKIKYFDNIDDVDTSNIDFVDIASPTQFHFEYLKKYIIEWKNILVEKPLVSTIEQTNEIESLVLSSKYKWKIAVWLIERFSLIAKEIKNIINLNWAPRQIEIFRYNPWSWRIQWTDVSTDLMIHDIDLLKYLTGHNLEVNWRVICDDSSVVVWKTWDTNIVIWANRITQQKIRQVKIYYDDKTIVWDLMLSKLDIYHKPEKYLSSGWNDLDIAYMIEEKIIAKSNQLKFEIEDFIKYIKTWKRDIIADLWDWLSAMKILDKIKNHN